MNPRIVMVDLKIGNLQSVKHAFDQIRTPVVISDDPTAVVEADAVVLPGVGAFGDAMAHLKHQRLIDPIRDHVLKRRKPMLGICLGMQLMADASEEYGDHEGLGLVPGRVVRLQRDRAGLRVPNMGWCDVRITQSRSQLFNGAESGAAFYFAHSYHLECRDAADVAAVIDGTDLVAAIERGGVYGVQFHPEKSQDAGLNLLAQFARQVSGSARVAS